VGVGIDVVLVFDDVADCIELVTFIDLDEGEMVELNTFVDLMVEFVTLIDLYEPETVEEVVEYFHFKYRTPRVLASKLLSVPVL
jgi:hypothetical protein